MDELTCQCQHARPVLAILAAHSRSPPEIPLADTGERQCPAPSWRVGPCRPVRGAPVRRFPPILFRCATTPRDRAARQLPPRIREFLQPGDDLSLLAGRKIGRLERGAIGSVVQSGLCGTMPTWRT